MRLPSFLFSLFLLALAAPVAAADLQSFRSRLDFSVSLSREVVTPEARRQPLESHLRPTADEAPWRERWFEEPVYPGSRASWPISDYERFLNRDINRQGFGGRQRLTLGYLAYQSSVLGRPDDLLDTGLPDQQMLFTQVGSLLESLGVPVALAYNSSLMIAAGSLFGGGQALVRERISFSVGSLRDPDGWGRLKLSFNDFYPVHSSNVTLGYERRLGPGMFQLNVHTYEPDNTHDREVAVFARYRIRF